LMFVEVDQDVVRRVLAELGRELREQVALQGTNTEHEEAPEADRHQNHARLVPGPPEADDSVPYSKAWRARQRRRGADKTNGRRIKRSRDHGQAAGDEQAAAE